MTDINSRPRKHGRTHAPGGSDLIPGLGESGWTVTFGGVDEPVVAGELQVVWEVPRQFSTNINGNGWYVFDPAAKVEAKSTSGDISIWIARIRSNGTSTHTVAYILDSPIVIEEDTYSSRVAASQPVVTQFANLYNEDDGPVYDSLAITIYAGDEGTGAAGLSISVPIGFERVPNSGVH